MTVVKVENMLFSALDHSCGLDSRIVSSDNRVLSETEQIGRNFAMIELQDDRTPWHQSLAGLVGTSKHFELRASGTHQLDFVVS